MSPFFALMLMFQAATPAPKDTPPAIPQALLVQFFKTQAEYMGAKSEVEATPQWKKLQDKQNEAGSVSQQINTICGAKFHAQLDTNGYPVCVDNPEPPKPAATAPAPKTAVPAQNPAAPVKK